jgi:hypothetical protein
MDSDTVILPPDSPNNCGGAGTHYQKTFLIFKENLSERQWQRVFEWAYGARFPIQVTWHETTLEYPSLHLPENTCTEVVRSSIIRDVIISIDTSRQHTNLTLFRP